MRGVRKLTETKLKARKRMGLGMGDGCLYQPTIRVQDFSSRGVQSRIPLAALKRTAHVHSGVERSFLLVQEYLYDILQYKEQFPLDRSTTLGYAAALGVKHPVKDGTTVIMTIDAVVTTRDSSGEITTAAYDMKLEEDLLDKRVQEKLSISAAYCAQMALPYYIFTERSASDEYIDNIDDIRGKRFHELEDLPVADLFTRHPRVMVTELLDGSSAKSMLEFCRSYDVRHSLPTGTGIRVLKHLVWNHNVRVNLDKRLWLEQPLPARAELSLVKRDGTPL